MQSKRTTEESTDRGVSPVIGVILMVAITVILAAVIAAFVLDIGPAEPSPSAAISSNEDPEDLTVELNSLDNADAVVVVDGSDDDSEIVHFSGNSGDDEAALTVNGQEEDFEDDGETIQAVRTDDVEDLEGDEEIGDVTDANAILVNLD